MRSLANPVQFDYGDLDEAFPDVTPGVEPLGSKILVQLRMPKRRTRGGVILIEEIQETEAYNTQVAKVIACGPLAFCNRNTGQPWPEGAWVKVGDFVRVPKYGNDRWYEKAWKTDENGERQPLLDDSGQQTEVLLQLLDDLHMIGKITGDPLAMKAYV